MEIRLQLSHQWNMLHVWLIWYAENSYREAFYINYAGIWGQLLDDSYRLL